MMQAPELPPFDYQPQPYRGPSAEEVLRSRRQFLNRGLFSTTNENSESIHATTNVDAIHGAEIPPNPSTAAMSAIIKQRGLPEDNIIVARDSQSGRRAC